MGRWKAFLPIVLALVIAVAGSLFTYKWVMTQVTPKETVQVAVKQESAVPVVVAAVGLPWGTKLKAEMLKTVPYLRESLPPGYCSQCTNIEGRVLISPVRAQEPILDSKLAPVGITSGGGVRRGLAGEAGCGRQGKRGDRYLRLHNARESSRCPGDYDRPEDEK